MQDQKTSKIVDLLPEEDEMYRHICELNLMEKRKAIKRLRSLKDFQFIEEIEGENTIGHIEDHGSIIQVSYLRDTIGSYIELSFMTGEITNVANAASYLSRWFINGRYEICCNNIRLFSIFPILDTPSLRKLISHALLEIWDMNNVATSDSVNKK